MNNTKKTVFAAMMLAVGILLPMAFHAVPNAGSVFAPMHLPVFIAGMICGPFYGALVATVCPLLSFIFTGMPTAAYLPNMTVELLCYSVFSALAFRLIKTRNYILDVYISLVIGMLLGRALGGFTAYLMYLGGNRSAYSWTAFYTAYFVTCLPGIAIQLVVIPSVLTVARQTGFLRESDRFISDRHYKDNAAKQKKFFDSLAPKWRSENALSADEIGKLFDGVEFTGGSRVLDVACGKGVLEPFLLSRGCKVDAIDISEAMIDLARKDPYNAGVNFYVADFYRFDAGEKYDKIIVFDAYPHFPDRALFADKAYDLLCGGGELWIIFDENREKINGHHGAASAGVTAGLKSADEEIKVYKRGFEVISKTDDGNGYRIGLKKKIRAKNKKKNSF